MEPNQETQINQLNSVFGRQLPYSIENEQALLGALILDSERIAETAAHVAFTDFYISEHQKIFQALLGLFAENRGIDVITLVNQLVRDGVYASEEAGSAYIRQLVENVPTLSNLLDYAAVVREKAQLRRLIYDCETIMADAYAQSKSAKDIIIEASSKIYELSQGKSEQDLTKITEILQEFYAELTALAEQKENPTALQTYYDDLDRVLVGMNPGDFILIGGRPGMGKTSFAMNIAAEIAKHRKDKAVAIFSLEMSKTQLASRLLSSEGRIDSRKLRDGQLEKEDYEKLTLAATALSETNLYIDDSSAMKPQDMLLKLHKIENLGLVVIDYLQLMEPDERRENRNQEVSSISRKLKLMAKELGVPVIACSQLARLPKDQKITKPQMSDLRDSGAIEQDADVVMLLHREGYYDRQNAAIQNIAECIVAKNRHGEARDIKICWEGQYTKFSPLEQRYEPEPGA